MAVLNLDKHLGNVKNRLSFIGVELEGGWKSLPAGTRLARDGSVFAQGAPRGFDANTMKMGEMPSPILEPATVPRWMKKYYPDFFDVTCGLHVHMSFKTAQHYEALMKEDYQDTLLHYLEKWGHEVGIAKTHTFWDRIKGKNQFCTKNFWPDRQVLAKSKVYDHANPGNRYTVLNFCWGLHGTIECRVLPMLPDVNMAIAGVRTIMDVTNATLVVLKARREKLVEEVIMTNDSTLGEEVDNEVIR